MRKGTVLTLAVVAAVTCAPSASAGFVGFESTGAYINGKFVCRVYAKFDADNFYVLSCFGIEGFAATDWNDSDFASGSWDPKFSIDSTVDSYVTIGGVPGFTNSTAADPEWGAAGFNQPGIPNGAGWFNANPSNFQGKVDGAFRTLIAQFVYPDPPMQGYASPLSVSFNQGLGTPTQFAFFGVINVCIPAPGAVAMLAVALFGSAVRRRRPA